MFDPTESSDVLFQPPWQQFAARLSIAPCEEMVGSLVKETAASSSGHELVRQ